MVNESHSRKRKRKKTPADIIFKGILIILLVFNILAISMGTSMGSAYVGNSPFSVIPVISGSMSPKIKSGDAILVKQEAYDNIVPGDIVVYAKDGDLIVHEVLGKDENQFIAKGIENTIEDLPVSKDAYRARYVFRIPLLGGIWRITGNPIKFVLLAVLIGLILFGDQIFSAVYTKVFDRDNAELKEKNNTMDKE